MRLFVALNLPAELRAAAWAAAEPVRAAFPAGVSWVREAGFARVALDLRGFRSGSLNVLAGVAAP